SLGGLLAKQILRTSSDSIDPSKHAVFERTHAVQFLATPHAGAELASLVDAFRRVCRSTVAIEDLRQHDPHLRELYTWYRHHSTPRIATATYYEMKPVAGFTIVNPTSAHPGVGADPVASDEDHISIAKPKSTSAQVCETARSLIRDHILKGPLSGPGTPLVVTKNPATRQGPPCELPRRATAEEFFGRQKELADLTARLAAGKHAAVVGPGGMGKTALAAEALANVVGPHGERLSQSAFPDGIVYLDLYRYKGNADAIHHALANAFIGAAEQQHAADLRARIACARRRALIVFEGAEEADGRDGRAFLRDIVAVLDESNHKLVLTRDKTQTLPVETIDLEAPLAPADAEKLFDKLTGGRVTGATRSGILGKLEGHPLALTWAGNLLGRGTESPNDLLSDWQRERLPSLVDPSDAKHTLHWLFERSTRGLDNAARTALAAAGLLAHAPFPRSAIEAALGTDSGLARTALRQLTERSLLHLITYSAGNDDTWQFSHVLSYQFARPKTADPALLQRLAMWDQTALQQALDTPANNIGQLLQHAGVLLQSDTGLKAESLALFLLYGATTRLTALGSLGHVGSALHAFADWTHHWPSGDNGTPQMERTRSVLYSRLGDLASDQGKLQEAERFFSQDLAITKRLAESNPANATWQRDLAVSLARLGDLAIAQGKIPDAEHFFSQTLDINQRLAESDTANADWQLGLSVPLIKLGDLATAQGQLQEAERFFSQALNITRRLAESDTANTDWQRGLSVALERLGDLAAARDQLQEAERFCAQSLDIAKRLAASDTINADWQRDLFVSFIKLAVIKAEQDQTAEALLYAEQSLSIIERLATEAPDHAQWQKDRAIALEFIAQLRKN
ncbi:MAG TPA: tetratricopeptide repeat protein, partial [Opitutaceae bacterium]|nr:tetratricopeptide repeat protein [Opitutaceae bacterium]